MSRLKDADALLEYLMINMGWHDEDGREVDDWDEKRKIFKDLIDGVPTVDAVPVVHGRWIDNKDSIIGEIIERNCSVCGQRTTGLYDHFFPYCPNCGAKMDGERRDIDDLRW